MNTSVRISPGEWYYDLRTKDELTVLDLAPHLDQVLIEIEGTVQEIRPLSEFLRALRRGCIVQVEEIRSIKASDEEH